MKKSSVLFLLLMLFSTFAFSQKNNTIKIQKVDTTNRDSLPKNNAKNRSYYYKTSIDLLYGYQHVDLNSLNQTLFRNGNNFSWNQVCYGADFRYLLNIGATSSAIGSLFCFSRIDPQKISTSDTSSSTLSGFRFHVMNAGFFIFPHNKFFGLIFYPGFEYGRLKLENETTGSKTEVYKNPFFAFNFMADLRVRLWSRGIGIATGTRGGYVYDIGNPRWTSISGAAPISAVTKMRGYYYSVFLSFSFW